MRESYTFVDPVFDERFASYRLLMFNEAAWDKEMQKLAFDSLKDDPSQVFRVIGRNTEQYFELDPSLNVNPETSDGRNMTFRDRTLWTFYIVTLLGLFGLVVRARDPMVLLLLVVAAYFTLSSLLVVAPPRVARPSTCAVASVRAWPWTGSGGGSVLGEARARPLQWRPPRHRPREPGHGRSCSSRVGRPRRSPTTFAITVE